MGAAYGTDLEFNVMTITTSSAVAAIEQRMLAAMPTTVDYASMRLWDERSESLSVRQNHLEPLSTSFDTGLMVSVWNRGGLGYAATSDLTDAGIAEAVAAASYWAQATSAVGVFDTTPLEHNVGTYASPVAQTWDALALDDRIALLQQADCRLGCIAVSPRR